MKHMKKGPSIVPLCTTGNMMATPGWRIKACRRTRPRWRPCEGLQRISNQRLFDRFTLNSLNYDGVTASIIGLLCTCEVPVLTWRTVRDDVQVSDAYCFTCAIEPMQQALAGGDDALKIIARIGCGPQPTAPATPTKGSRRVRNESTTHIDGLLAPSPPPAPSPIPPPPKGPAAWWMWLVS